MSANFAAKDFAKAVEANIAVDVAVAAANIRIRL